MNMPLSCLSVAEPEADRDDLKAPPLSRRKGKRFFDVVFSVVGLIVLGPLLLLIAVLIRVFDGSPVFYRQRRVGLQGAEFQICKFRTMTVGADANGPSITRGGDARITRLGRILRKSKLDELPQLWNVLKGEMSFVGPRPEVPCYVETYTPAQRLILNYKPGITDLATLIFRNEESLLRNAPNVEQFYIGHCIPRKVDLNLQYAQRANLFTDTWIILQTIFPSWLGVLFIYGVLLAASLWLAYWLVDGDNARRLGGYTVAAILSLKLAGLTWRKQHRALLDYFGLPELRQTCIALSVCFLVLLGSTFVLPDASVPPMKVLVVDLILSLMLLGVVRVGTGVWRDRSLTGRQTGDKAVRRVGIIGANETGAQIARQLFRHKHLGREVQAFFDDNVHKWHKRLHEVPIVGMPECLLEGWSDKLDEVIIAVPEASAERLQAIKQLVQGANFRCYTCPSLDGEFLSRS
jgi:lipopolysaccharide/colanic/teichoic acid biosynthesis glycosyltransferase